MNQQKTLEEALKNAGLKDKFRTVVGGAPCTPRWAARIGADAYAEDAQVTGIDGSQENLQKIANSVSNIVRQFNLREGLAPEDDRLPKGLHRELKKSGAVLTEAELETMLQDYYKLKGWNNVGELSEAQCV